MGHLTLACLDGGLLCIPAAVAGAVALVTGARCWWHKCHDHPCEKGTHEHDSPEDVG